MSGFNPTHRIVTVDRRDPNHRSQYRTLEVEVIGAIKKYSDGTVSCTLRGRFPDEDKRYKNPKMKGYVISEIKFSFVTIEKL